MDSDFKDISILIVDDHKLITSLIQLFLAFKQQFKEVKVANSYEEAMIIARETRIELAIVDILMPDKTGIQLVPEITKLNKDMKIMFLTSLISKKVIVEGLKLGVTGFLIKSADLEEIIRAIQIVMQGSKYFCPESMKVLLDIKHKAEPTEYSTDYSDLLTSREKDVLKLIIEDRHVAEIAEILCLSPRTIETHKKNIMSKLGVKSTLSLVKLYYENQFLDS